MESLSIRYLHSKPSRPLLNYTFAPSPSDLARRVGSDPSVRIDERDIDRLKRPGAGGVNDPENLRELSDVFHTL